MATRKAKAIVDKPIIPGIMWRVRAWLFLLSLVGVAANTAWGVGSHSQAQIQAGVLIGLIVNFIGAVNTPYELPNTASELIPWLTTERCFWIYRGVVLLGSVMAGFGAGNEAQWSTFTAAIGTIFGLGALVARTSLVKAVNAPEVT